MTSEAGHRVAAATVQNVLLRDDIAAPSRPLLSYDELIDARQTARALQGSWRDQSLDTSLAYWWPLKQLADSDQEDPSQDLAQQTAGWADPKETSNPRHGHSTHKAPLQQCSSRAKQQCRQNAQPLTAQRPVRRSVPMARGRGSSDSGPDSNTDDSIHTAHFSDEGELSEADTGTTAEQQQKHRGTKQGPVVLYHGPNSQQLAAIRASSRPPPGPRPQLGDALLEAIHSDDVKMSAKATGVLEEPISRDKWQCIMRRRCADGQVVECGCQNLWYMRQCVECDATHGAIELSARVSAILQTSDASRISDDQVMNRLKTYSSSPGGLTHAFTLEMVQQAIKDWSLGRGRGAAQQSGPSAQKQRTAQMVALPSAAPGPQQVKAATVDQQWAHSATALQQALTTLATARPSKRLRKDSSPRRSTDTQQGDGPSSALAAAGSATPTGLAQQADPVGNPGGDPGANPGATPVGNPAVGGSALHRGDPSGTHATTAGGVDSAAGQSNRLGVNSNSHDGWRVGQGAAGQAFYFAHDLLDAVMRQQPKHVKSSKKRDEVSQWVQARRPSAYGRTQAEMHRRVFQLPALPSHQAPQRQTWQRPMAHPTLTILYPATPAQPSDPSAPPHLQHPLHQQQTAHPLTGAEACDASPQPMNAAAAEIVQSEGAIAETVEAQRQSQQSLGTSAQAASFLPSPAAASAAAHEAEAAEAEADKAAEGGAASAEGFEAEGGKAAAAVGGGSSSGGWVEEAPHCDGPRGLQPRAAARGLAGPTLHILVEGYDVYTDSGLKRKGHDFPLQEVVRVSQDSRHLWLHQRPFKLKRGKPEDVAKGAHRRGGWRQRQGTKVDTRQIALDRQQAMEPPCSIGASGNPSAFRPFSSPSGRHNSTPSERDLGGSQACDRPGAASAQPLGGQSHAATAQQAQQHACDEGETNDALAGMHGQQQQPQASAKAAQSHDEGRASAHGPDRPVAGPSNGAPGLPAGAASAGCLEAPGDTAMAEQFRDMGGDAWKVFYMASRMGLRPDVIQKAATRLRSLQQQPE